MFNRDTVAMNSAPAVPVLRKLLVVDDNPIIQRTVYFALRDKGFLVLMAGAVADGLNLIRQQKPELVLLDLNFASDSADVGAPSWDGFAAMEWLRHTGDCANIPIIVITGFEEIENKERATSCGAVAFIHKPINHDDLLKVIRATLGGSAKPA